VLHVTLGAGMILAGLLLAKDVVRRDRSTAPAV